jgi:hypothetical protein
MNSLIKISAVGTLALGGVAAHAAIVVPSSSNKPGDVLLFADIFTGATLDATYVGDTGVTVDSVVGGTRPGNYAASSDANLSSFLAEATTGTTVIWSVIGGGGKNGGNNAEFVSTSNTGVINPTNGGNLVGWSIGLNGAVNTINGLISSSVPPDPVQTSFKGSDVSNLGTDYNPLGTSTDASNWFGGNQQNFITGLGTQAKLFAITAAGFGGANQTTQTPEFYVTLTSSGLTYTPISAVPLPAAVWLLGSGLLGLVGVARRKIAA